MVNQNNNEFLQAGFEKLFTNHDLTENQIYEKLIHLRKKVDNQDILEKIIKSYKVILNGESNHIFRFNEYDKLEFSKLLDDEKKLARYVIYRYKYKTYPQDKIVEDYPPCVQIEPASVCNFRCIMCYQTDKTFSSKKNGFMGFMKFELFKRIIDELEGNVEAITFASRGEPTLNKDLVKFLDYCKDKFVAIKINSNLSNLNEELAEAIFRNNVQTLVISSDAPDKVNYEKIRVKGNFEKLLKNMELLLDIKKKFSNTNTIIRASGVKISENQDFKKMKEVYGKFTDSVAFVNYLPWESSYTNKTNNEMNACSDLWKRIFVWYDGVVNPCDYDYKSILSKFNYNQTDIKDIWNSKHYNELRKKHLNKQRSEIYPCKGCTNT